MLQGSNHLKTTKLLRKIKIFQSNVQIDVFTSIVTCFGKALFPYYTWIGKNPSSHQNIQDFCFVLKFPNLCSNKQRKIWDFLLELDFGLFQGEVNFFSRLCDIFPRFLPPKKADQLNPRLTEVQWTINTPGNSTASFPTHQNSQKWILIRTAKGLFGFPCRIRSKASPIGAPPTTSSCEAAPRQLQWTRNFGWHVSQTTIRMNPLDSGIATMSWWAHFVDLSVRYLTFSAFSTEEKKVKFPPTKLV